MKFRKQTALAACISVIGCAAHADLMPVVEKRDLNMYIVGAPVAAVLDHIMLSFGTDAKIEPDVDQMVSSYRISGNFESVISGLADQFNLHFFAFNDIVYVSRAEEAETKILKIQGARPSAAIESLRTSGLPVDRFSVVPVAGSDALVVTAPKEFIRISEALLLSMTPSAPETNSIRVRRGVSVSSDAVLVSTETQQ